MPGNEDKNLIRRLQQDDPITLDELYDRNGAVLPGVIFNITGNIQSAEEVLQNCSLA